MLKDILRKYTKEVYPMHMPGHKGGRMKMIEDVYRVDVTEVPGTDHLYKAEGILKESMEGLAEFYGTRKTVYLVNGSTAGILSAIGGLHREGDQILVARNCHQSVFNGIVLNKLSPIYIYPKVTPWGLPGGVDPEEVRKVLAENPEIVSFVMTSPTYDGFISDIQAINKLCERYNVTLIVDEAHGAHLPYSDYLPASALEAKPGVVIHSVHKTLPVITGAGLLHLNLPKDQEEGVLAYLQKIQTSSPSYIMMASMDTFVHEFGLVEKMWRTWLSDVDKLSQKLKKLKKLKHLVDYKDSEAAVVAMDPLKSVILTAGSSVDGTELSAMMRQEMKIQMELWDKDHILGIMTLADSRQALNAYGRALLKLDKKVKKADYQVTAQLIEPILLNQGMRPWQGDIADCEMVALETVSGRIAASHIVPYPPGIPLIVTGEIYTDEAVDRLVQMRDMGIELVGLEENMVKVALTD